MIKQTIALVGLTLSLSANAIDVRIDFTNPGYATGGNWNVITDLNLTNSDLIDYGSGLATGVSVTGSGWTNFNGDETSAWATTDWIESSAVEKGAGVFSGSFGSFTFAGLDSGSYQIEVVSARSCCSYLNTIRIDGDIADRTYNGAPVTTPFDARDDGLLLNNWLIWDNVNADLGSITLDLSTTSTLGMVNAVRITGASVVPVPAAAWLFGSALVGLVGFKRKK